jgi:hypothetical protein
MRNLPAITSSSKSLLVAAITLTSILRVLPWNSLYETLIMDGMRLQLLLFFALLFESRIILLFFAVLRR